MSVEVLKKMRSINPSSAYEPREHMKDLLLKILKGILPHPDDIQVTFKCGEQTTIYEITCHELDYGHLLGKKGATISSLRCILSATLARNDIRGIIEAPYVPKPSGRE